MSAAEFKPRCLEVFERVATEGDEVAVTKHARAMVRVTKADARRPWPFPDLSGMLMGELGDVITPIDVDWDAMKRSCSTRTR